MSLRVYAIVKRALDVGVAALALVLSAPLQAAVALVVLARMGRPVLFRQVRPGRFGQPFTLVEFRTMTAPSSEDQPLPDADRMTRLGRTLRATSLDELPTLWNVVLGDMSLVGPRPLLMEYLPLYTKEQWRRHDVRPGVTGLAQVNGRNVLPWPDRLALDTRYVDSGTLLLDLRILFRTVAQVLRRDGITGEGQATVKKFDPRSEAR